MNETTPLRPPAPAPVSAPAAPAIAGGDGDRPPLRIAATILQLAILGIVGSAAATVIGSAFGVGLALVVVLGVGLVILVGVLYALFGLGWFEVRRIGGLYAVPLADLRWRPRHRPGFGGWIRSVGAQSIDGRMWRALADLAIATVLGGLVLRVFWGVGWSVVIAFAPLFDTDAVDGLFGWRIDAGFAPIVGALGAALGLGAIVGIALLHRVIALAIVVPSREAELSAQVRVTSAQREGAVRAADVERTRIERDLHDGVQPRLVSVGMTLGLAQQKIDDDPAAAKALIAEAHTSTKAAITELRQLARGIHTSVLDDRGLDAALSALAGRSHVPVHLDVRIEGRCRRDAEAAVYFAIAESLTNAAKHSRASACRVLVRRRDDGTLWARVEDDGMGGAQVQPGGGIDGVANRVLAAGGTFRLDSPLGGPTTLEVSVPCGS